MLELLDLVKLPREFAHGDGRGSSPVGRSSA